MPQNEMDPAASTQMFRAFVDEPATQPAAPAKSNTPMIAGGVVVALIVIALAVWLVVA